MTAVEALHPDRPLFARTGVNLASAGPGARSLRATDAVLALLGRMLENAEALLRFGRDEAHGRSMDG